MLNPPLRRLDAVAAAAEQAGRTVKPKATTEKKSTKARGAQK
jgi:hypothetical protein